MEKTVAEAIRATYEQRPYPAVNRNVLRRLPWRLPPFDWISTIAQSSWNAPQRVLVAGCGTGLEAFAVRRRYPRTEIVGVDFAARSIQAARQLQKRSPQTRDICFVRADLTSDDLVKETGGHFDFISCHGVLSYLPLLDRALRNLARCLTPEGVLYAGVNGAAHFSEAWRKFLPAFGFEMANLPVGKKAWEYLELTAHLSGDARSEILRFGPAYLGSDLFAPLIRNLPVAEWVRRFRKAGLHFRGSRAAARLLRPAINDGRYSLLMPRSRAEIAALLEVLRPGAFHNLIFTRQAEVVPPWGSTRELLRWRPEQTRYLRRFQWPHARAGRSIQLENRAANVAIEMRSAGWEIELLRASDGERSLRELVAPSHRGTAWREQIYQLYLLDLLNFLPPVARGRSSSRRPRT